MRRGTPFTFGCVAGSRPRSIGSGSAGASCPTSRTPTDDQSSSRTSSPRRILPGWATRRDAEIHVLALAQPSVGDQGPEGVEVADPGVRILGRDRASCVWFLGSTDGVADLDRSPIQLSSSCGPAPSSSISIRNRRRSTIEGALAAARRGPIGHDADGVAGRVPPGRSHRTRVIGRPQNAGQRLRPRPDDDVAHARPPWMGISMCSPRPTSSSTTRSIGEGQPERRGGGVRVGGDLDQPAHHDPVDEPVRSSPRRNRRPRRPRAGSGRSTLGVRDPGCGPGRSRIGRRGACPDPIPVASRGRRIAVWRPGAHIRKTPNRVSGIGAWRRPRCPSPGPAGCRADR